MKYSAKQIFTAISDEIRNKMDLVGAEEARRKAAAVEVSSENFPAKSFAAWPSLRRQTKLHLTR